MKILPDSFGQDFHSARFSCLHKAVFYNRTSTCCPPSVVATCTTRGSTAGWCLSKPNLFSTTPFSWCIMTSSAMRRSRNWRSCLSIACKPQKFIPSSPTRKWNLWPGLVKRKIFSLNLLRYFYIVIIILHMHGKLFFLQKKIWYDWTAKTTCSIILIQRIHSFK